MQVIDWILVIIPLFIVLGISIYTQRYMKSVADFLSGGRVAGRYLLAVSRGELGAPAVGFVAGFEVIAKSGFTTNWWTWINIPIALLVSVTGFVAYRYRETRALTLAQFFEIRYSRPFRVFMGILGFAAGLVNFGIIPVVEARLITTLFELPPILHLFSLSIPTYTVVMAALMSITLLLTVAGGLITVMVTNCVEGIITQILYVVLILGLMSQFHWTQISAVLGTRPPGHSLLNPFDSMGLKDFNLWWVLMGMFMSIYSTMAWQNQSAYNAASITAHEARMGNILGGWRNYGKVAVGAVLGICAMTYLQHADFAAQSAAAHLSISHIPNHEVRQQMEIPMALTHLLPGGLKGALCIILLMGIFGGDSAHLHSWGGLLVQDVMVPLRKKAITPEQHIRYLRLSIAGVAVFSFIFGLLFRQTEYIVMWFQVTMGLFVAGAGAAIIGGLYWKKGTTAGAWTAALCGTALSAGGIVMRQIYGDNFWLNGMQIEFFSAIIASALYVVVSYLTCKENFNMERMLHRGEYARKDEKAKPMEVSRSRWTLKSLLSFDENFSGADKWITGGLFGWNMMWFGIFAIGSLYNWIVPWPTSVWSEFWRVAGVWVPIFLAIVTGVWFTWGGVADMRDLFRRLNHGKINAMDNGMVKNHQNLDEAMEPEREREASRSDAPSRV